MLTNAPQRVMPPEVDDCATTDTKTLRERLDDVYRAEKTLGIPHVLSLAYLSLVFKLPPEEVEELYCAIRNEHEQTNQLKDAGCTFLSLTHDDSVFSESHQDNSRRPGY